MMYLICDTLINNYLLTYYTHGHINKTDPPIFLKFIAKCYSLRPLSSEMKDNLFERIPLSQPSVHIPRSGVLLKGSERGNSLCHSLEVSVV